MIGNGRGEWRGLAEFFSRQKVRILQDAPLSSVLTLGIGGSVRLLAFFSAEESLAACRQACHAAGAPFVVVGGGSNIAAADGRLEFVAAVNQTRGIELLDGERLRCAGGVTNGTLLNWCRKQGAGGLEFLAGIPGTAGGAAAVNAGAFGRCLADVLIGARILGTDGGTREAGRDFFNYSYRDSALKFSPEMILSVTLRFQPQAGQAIAAKIAANRRHRRQAHPSYRLATAGCFFKNPLVGGAKVSAGRLLEECGLKGERFGRLLLSERHANFLVNAGGASFAELVETEEKIRSLILERKGIRLEREVVYVDARGRKW